MLVQRIICVFLCVVIFSSAEECKSSITTASGSNAPPNICSGQLIFDESFNNLDKQIWKPMVTFWDGGVSDKALKFELDKLKFIN